MATIADGFERFVQGCSSGGMHGIRFGGDGDASRGAGANHDHFLRSGTAAWVVSCVDVTSYQLRREAKANEKV